MIAGIVFKLQIFALICILLSSCAISTEVPTPTIPAADFSAQTQPPALDPPSTTETPIPTTLPEATRTQPVPTPRAREAPVLEIAIEGPLAESKAEVSGLAWWGELLLILPQYPENYLSDSGIPTLFAVSKTDLINYLENSSPAPIEPIQIAISNSIGARQVPGYEGFEAIATNGELVYLTIEANHRGVMQGYLIEGHLIPDGAGIDLDPDSLIEIPTPVQIFNSAYEAVLPTAESVMVFFEANGEDLNPEPEVMIFGGEIEGFLNYPMPNIEYRITDSTDIDAEGRFWVLNIFMPLEFWYYTLSDPITEQYGLGSSHAGNIQVERLLELKYNQGQISLSGSAPLYLSLDDADEPRNWEGLVRLDELGFLAVTDTYPGTILAFIPYP